MIKAKDALREILEAIDEVSALHPGENGNTTALITRWKREIDALPEWANIDLDDDELDYDDSTDVDEDDKPIGLAAGMTYDKKKSPTSGVMEPGIVNTADGPKIGTGALLDNQPPYPNPPRDRPKEGSLKDNRKLPDQVNLPPSAEELEDDAEEANERNQFQDEDVTDEDAKHGGKEVDEKSKFQSGLKNKAPKAK